MMVALDRFNMNVAIGLLSYTFQVKDASQLEIQILSLCSLPVDVPILDDLQNSLIKSPFIDVELKPSSDIHISLTKTVVLQHHWIDSFVSSVRNELVLTKKWVTRFVNSY